MAEILRTERLILREHEERDAEDMHRLCSDPRVMRYTHEGPSTSADAMAEAIRNYPDYRAYGYGRWSVIHDDRFIGFAGPKYLPDLNEVDLGYRLLPEFWGRGLATEAARGVIDHCFDRLDITDLVAFVLQENLASIRVLEKCGFDHEEDVTVYGVSARRYTLRKP